MPRSETWLMGCVSQMTRRLKSQTLQLAIPVSNGATEATPTHNHWPFPIGSAIHRLPTLIQGTRVVGLPLAPWTSLAQWLAPPHRLLMETPQLTGRCFLQCCYRAWLFCLVGRFSSDGTMLMTRAAIMGWR